MNRAAIPGEKPGAALPEERAAAVPGAIVTAEERHRMIAEAAYFRALQRGLLDGYELGDWLDAEKEIDARLLG
ncbi:MAG: DUF2934 domain-containing protein [Pseudomonadota bacterium]